MFQKIKNREKYEMLIWQKDALYDSWWFHKCIKKLMLSGKKHIIEKHFQISFSFLKIKIKKLPYYVFLHTFNRLRPILGIVFRRVARKIHTVPVPIRYKRQLILALSWITKAIISHKNKQRLSERITSEYLDLLEAKQSLAFKTRNEHFRLLTKSRIYAHFRWV